jgi:hypothetical protein
MSVFVSFHQFVNRRWPWRSSEVTSAQICSAAVHLELIFCLCTKSLEQLNKPINHELLVKSVESSGCIVLRSAAIGADISEQWHLIAAAFVFCQT